MLRIHTIGASALVLLAFTGLASAADVTRTTPIPLPQPVYPVVQVPTGWSGPYAGVMGGYGWVTGTVANRGWIGGVYAGYNTEIESGIVAGIEADGSLTSKSGTSAGTRVQNPWDATIRGRLGFGSDNWLLYGTGGIAFGQVKATTGSVTEADNKTGWTAGVGLETKLTTNVTARVEYRHTNLGTATFTTSPSIAYRSNDLLVGFGVNF